MPSVIVNELDWYMELPPEYLIEDGYIQCTPVFHRNGAYCHPNAISPNLQYWFEYDGTAWTVFDQSRAVSQIKYALSVSDEFILSDTEVNAMKIVLYRSRDAVIKKSIKTRLSIHKQSVDHRAAFRTARLEALKAKIY